MNNRKIIHVDMDAFFAAVEQRDNPQLKGKPVIVGGPPDSRGVVATCSYEARKFGIHSAMASSRAGQLCPQGFFVKPRFQAYKDASKKIHQVFQQYTDLIEPLSLDEAYLDVTQTLACDGSATLMAKEIRQKIFESTGLTASAGISYNKFLAKVASDINKPNGQCLIKPEEGEAFVQTLAVGKFYGVGKVTEAKMHSLKIYTGADLKSWSKEKLAQYFGKSSAYYYSIARGVDNRPVSNHRVRKSIGSETTFQKDVVDVSEMKMHLNSLAQEVIESLKQKKLVAYTLTIKIKYANFQQITRSKTFDMPLGTVEMIKGIISVLLDKTEVQHRSIRLLGVSVSNLSKNAATKGDMQPGLFD
jgi:DNA polymerase IV